MKRTLPHPVVPLLLRFLVPLFSVAILGQAITPDVILNPAWDALFAAAQPESGNTATDVDLDHKTDNPDGMPISNIWSRKERGEIAEFVLDIYATDRKSPEWQNYFPAAGPQASLNNHYSV